MGLIIKFGKVHCRERIKKKWQQKRINYNARFSTFGPKLLSYLGKELHRSKSYEVIDIKCKSKLMQWDRF